MRFFVSASLFFLSVALTAQEGAPLLIHFGESRDVENQNWAICQDNQKVMLFASRLGISSFDGTSWTPVRTEIIPFTINLNSDDNRIYVGGENCYGYIERDLKGIYRYEPLDSSSLGLITKIIFNDSIACFYGDKSISLHNLKADSLAHRFFPPPGTFFTGMFTKGGNTYINVSGKGLFRIEGDSLFPIVTGYLTEKTEILFSLPYDTEKKLLGFSNGRMSLFDGIKYYDYRVSDDSYIADNVLSEGISIGDSLYAFSTLGGGAAVVEKITGKVRFIINNQAGLPDDEIFAMGSDAAGGLWLSHSYGLTRADLNLPVRNYGVYQGLKGNFSTALRHDGELYVATSEGVFYLAYIENFTDEVKLVKMKNEIVPAKTVIQATEEITKPLIPPSKTRENTRKSIFTRLFGKKENPEETGSPTGSPPRNIAERPNTAPIIPINDLPVQVYRTERVKKLKSVDYVYKKIEGLNEKCRQLVPSADGILAATNMGLYIIRDHKATLLEGSRYVNFISWDPHDGKYLIATGNGYFFASGKNKKWSVEVPDRDFNEPVYSIIRGRGDTLWLGGNDVAFMAVPGIAEKGIDYRRFTVKNNFLQRYLLSMINDTVFLFTETGVSFFSEEHDRFEPYKAEYRQTTTDEIVFQYPPSNLAQDEIIFKYPVSNLPLIVSGNQWKYPEVKKRITDKDLCLLRLFDDIVSVYSQRDHIWVVDGENRLFGIDCSKTSEITEETEILIKKIHNGKGTFFALSDVVFERGDNVIEFEIVVPGYLSKHLTQYQYYIDKVMPDWSPWSTETTGKEIIPRAGDYTLVIRAKDLWGQVGDPVTINFTMKAPFTQTTLFYIVSILLVLVIIFAIIHFRERQLQEKNRILEEKVKERTAEIEAQKEEITSSIAYASRIQMAMLPVSNLFNESFSDYFILFRPRDIVSGDFYWIGQDGKNIFLTVADCTGHGVPGAFMSTLGISILNEIVNHNRDLRANTFLNLLREKIKTSLHQTGKEGEAADGMDISLCVLRKNRSHMQFSGAYNSLFLHTNGDLKEYKADRMPIGIHYGDEPPFTNYDIRIRKGDVVYLLSDGLTDQFGGPDGSKYKKAQLKKLFTEIHHRPMSEQKKLIELEFLKWKGKNEQVDDVTVIGVRI